MRALFPYYSERTRTAFNAERTIASVGDDDGGGGSTNDIY